jgi:hypothetical protein
MGLGDGTSESSPKPPPAVGATLIAASVVVLVIGLGWLNRSGDLEEQLTAPMANGATSPTDSDGRPVEIPPSQPATAVSFGPHGEVVRPDPVRARVVNRSGIEVIIRLPPNTTVDTVTGEIVPRPDPTTTRPGSTSSTTDQGGTTSSVPNTTEPPTTEPPTTEPPTTEPPTTQPPTTEPPTTQPPTTEPPAAPGPLSDLLDAILP